MIFINLNGWSTLSDSRSIFGTSYLTYKDLLLYHSVSAGITDTRQLAYVFATAQHESQQFTSLSEKWNGDDPLAYFRDVVGYEGKYGNIPDSDDPFTYRGRGFVQLTFRANYQTMGDIFGVDLINHPGLAADPVLAAKITAYGMRFGKFRGNHNLNEFINDTETDYYNAREIINNDVIKNGNLVAGYAKTFENLIEANLHKTFIPHTIDARTEATGSSLIGGMGNDHIYGGSGGDRIEGGMGSDILDGGTGSDTFVFHNHNFYDDILESYGYNGSITPDIDTIVNPEDSDRIVIDMLKTSSSVSISGPAKIIGKDFYELNGTHLLKVGSDLYIRTDDNTLMSGVRIQNFFKSTYDPKADYSFMGITIPKLTDADGDGIDDNAEKNAANADLLIKQANAVFAEAGAASLVDPLIIDLSGNGIALNSWQVSSALFDLNGDGSKENTGWTKANGDDVFLVIDKNSNGNIDNVNEMFGNPSVNGFAELSKYDSNKDNLINATDTQFSLLKLWNDKDADGTVDAGEMTTLSANKVTEISLNKYASIKQIAGNLQTAVSTVTKTDGTTRNIHELAFRFETTTAFTNPDANLPASFHLNISSVMLPYSRGYGNLYSWQAAVIPALDAGSRAANDNSDKNEEMVNYLLTA